MTVRVSWSTPYEPGRHVLRVSDDEGDAISILMYKVTGKSIYISRTDTVPEFQRKGINHILFTAMIELHPETEQIEATFVDSNAKELMDAFARTGNCEEAMRAAPTYKTSARAGFDRIISADCVKRHLTLGKR